MNYFIDDYQFIFDDSNKRIKVINEEFLNNTIDFIEIGFDINYLQLVKFSSDWYIKNVYSFSYDGERFE